MLWSKWKLMRGHLGRVSWSTPHPLVTSGPFSRPLLWGYSQARRLRIWSSHAPEARCAVPLTPGRLRPRSTAIRCGVLHRVLTLTGAVPPPRRWCGRGEAGVEQSGGRDVGGSDSAATQVALPASACEGQRDGMALGWPVARSGGLIRTTPQQGALKARIRAKRRSFGLGLESMPEPVWPSSARRVREIPSI